MLNRARYPSLSGRVVFITGGGTGIGERLVKAFCDQGSAVAFVDINDIANAAMFLSADDSAMITGQSLVVDGGWV